MIPIYIETSIANIPQRRPSVLNHITIKKKSRMFWQVSSVCIVFAQWAANKSDDRIEVRLASN
ncbi:hypothetical protein N007_11325 [Alicyclobacillus acidoterrestris ATCC 49025]|nr:hypothetical protein N007_11325 [Alicyclobacillus acidoterrestris ATCC 49025]